MTGTGNTCCGELKVTNRASPREMLAAGFKAVGAELSKSFGAHIM
jgi:hypothetical protein